jgi:branched-chain amino acid transport system substrate-binding protein
MRSRPVTRRSLLKGAASAGAGGVLAACAPRITGSVVASSGRDITIGFVTPLTGQLAASAAGDPYVLRQVRGSPPYARGFTSGGKRYRVTIVVADSQSDPSRAAEVARQLILSRHVDMILATSAPETANPVAGVAQAQGVPCLATAVPWESWYAGLGGDPAKPVTSFRFCAMFFFGLRELQGCFAPMWRRVRAGPAVACQYPDDADGNAFRAGFLPLIRAAGFRPVDGGAYADGTTGYAPMISLFASQHCELYSSCPLPADFAAFWKQASQRGWKPRLATVAKVLQFPAGTAALGPLASNIATASWWGPYMPYRSSLTGQTAASLARGYQAATGNQWVQSLGSSYALFEVAREAFTAAGDPHDYPAVAHALRHVSYEGMNGPISFDAGPAPGVGIVRPVGAQWQRGARFPFEMQVVDNSLNPRVPITAKLAPTGP